MASEPASVRSTDPTVVRRAQADLYAERATSMTRLAFLLTGSVQVAEELVHDAFEQVVRRWDDIAYPPAYLRLAVVNGARSWGRRTRRSEPASRSETFEIDQDAIAVRDALTDLRQDEREALVMRFFAGLSDSQIAIELDRPLGSVKSNIRRGLARMKEALQ